MAESLLSLDFLCGEFRLRSAGLGGLGDDGGSDEDGVDDEEHDEGSGHGTSMERHQRFCRSRIKNLIPILDVTRVFHF